MERATQMIPMELIKSNPFQPRKEFDENKIDELSRSIEKHGLIQPIVVRKISNQYQIIAGERRVRACIKLGMKEVPGIIVEIDGIEVAEMSLIENIQREDLNCIEEAVAYSILKSRFGLTQEDIAKRLGKSRSYIGNMLRLLDLPEEIKKVIINGDISMGHGRALLAIRDEDTRFKALDKIMNQSLSVRQTEEYISKLVSPPENEKKEKRQNVVKYFKDARIYLNTIKKALDDIKDAGGKADVLERETEDYLEISVRIPKGETIVRGDK